MTDPYQAPDADISTPSTSRRAARPLSIVIAIIWMLGLMVFIPTISVGPTIDRQPPPMWGMKATTLGITLFVLFLLSRAVSGWRHLLVAPLWLGIAFLQGVICLLFVI